MVAINQTCPKCGTKAHCVKTPIMEVKKILGAASTGILGFILGGPLGGIIGSTIGAIISSPSPKLCACHCPNCGYTWVSPCF